MPSRFTLPDDPTGYTAVATVADRVREQLAILRTIGDHDPRVLHVAAQLMDLYRQQDPEMTTADAREWLDSAIASAVEIVRDHDAKQRRGTAGAG
jgi:hypothetical protein